MVPQLRQGFAFVLLMTGIDAAHAGCAQTSYGLSCHLTQQTHQLSSNDGHLGGRKTPYMTVLGSRIWVLQTSIDVWWVEKGVHALIVVNGKFQHNGKLYRSFVSERRFQQVRLRFMSDYNQDPDYDGFKSHMHKLPRAGTVTRKVTNAVNKDLSLPFADDYHNPNNPLAGEEEEAFCLEYVIRMVFALGLGDELQPRANYDGLWTKKEMANIMAYFKHAGLARLWQLHTGGADMEVDMVPAKKDFELAAKQQAFRSGIAILGKLHGQETSSEMVLSSAAKITPKVEWVIAGALLAAMALVVPRALRRFHGAPRGKGPDELPLSEGCQAECIE